MIRVAFQVEEDGNISVTKLTRPKRTEKGKSLLKLTDTFVALDIETTGFDPMFDEIIEVGAIKVIDGVVVDEYTTLVKPCEPIDRFTTELTGITNAMLTNAPLIETVLPTLLDFIGDNVVVGHNVHFDINFLYDCCMELMNKPFTNDLIDTMRIARNGFKDIQRYTLSDLAEHFEVERKVLHRALEDCRCVLEIYSCMYVYLRTFNIDLSAQAKVRANWVSAKDITTATTVFDEDHPLYGKVCVFTGTLDKMQRADAMQAVADVGGICANNVTKKTNFLVLGVADYSITKDGKSSKHKKAEQYKLSGQDIEIVSENVFYDMIAWE